MLGKIGAALSAAALVTTLTAVPAEAVASTTHCGVKTTWRFVDSDDDGVTKIKLYKKPASSGKIPFCAEAFDLKKTGYRVLLMVTSDQSALGSKWGADKVSMLVRPASSIRSLYTEARVVNREPHVVWTGWWRR